jgi:ribonuclease-3
VKFLFPFFRKEKSTKDLELIRFFITRFGYQPKNLKLFQQALTHRSLLAHGDAEVSSNERLEFLGDTILDSVIAEYLYEKFPDNDEGYLTKIKAKVVSRKTLSEIGEEMELRKILRYNKNRSINLSSLEGNAFEAIIGAIFLDSNYETTRTIIRKHVFRKYLDLNKTLEEEIDFKSRLFIWSQKQHVAIEFIVLKEENNHGTWLYEVVVSLNEVNYGKGTGGSKKQAEQVAAKETLTLLGE